MARNRVTFSLNTKSLKKKLEKVKKSVRRLDQSDANNIAQAVVTDMKNLIKKGISPVKEVGRYQPYASQRDNDPRKYPRSVRKKHPSKRERPVNIKLSGQQLGALTSKTEQTSQGAQIKVGYLNSRLAQKKELGHASGVNNQPKRPTIPGSNQNFQTSIVNKIIRLLRKAVLNKLEKVD